MNVLVTGNMGYLGPLVVRQLRKALQPVRILGLDTGYFKDCLLDVRHLPDEAADEQILGDVRDVSPDLLAPVDSVVHLAGVSNDPIGNAFGDATMAVNHEATAALAEKARRAGVRSFVFASSCSVYGFAEDGARSEVSAVNPLTAYARSKVAAERAIEALASGTFTTTCLRFATACGISPRLRLDLALNDFVASAVGRGEIRVLSDGSPWRPLIDVADMARAIEWAVRRPASNGGASLVVNAGSAEWNYQVRDLARAVADAIPGVRVSINQDAQPDKRSYKVGFELFRELAPGHQPRVSLRQAISGLKTGLEQAGAAGPDFEAARFVRLNTLTRLQTEGRLGPDLKWRFPEGSAS